MDRFDSHNRDAMLGGAADKGAERGDAATPMSARAVPVSSASMAAAAAAAAAPAAAMLKGRVVLTRDADGQIILPPGVDVNDLRVVGNDIIVTLPNGQEMIIPGGATDVPTLQLAGFALPATNVAELLDIDIKFVPAAGNRSSGGNFADPEGAIGDPFALGDLLPPTALAFGQPRTQEIIPNNVDREPTTIIITPDNPTGAVDATSSVNEAGLPARGNEAPGSNSAADSEATAGSIVFDAPDGVRSITLNGTAITAVGQTFTTPLGTLTITSIAPGNYGYTYRLADNSNANTNPMDVFRVIVTDSDGDTAEADLTISIIDDVPTARNDTDAVAAGTYTPESGNVLTGVGTTSGAAGADTLGADTATLVGFRAGTAGNFVAAGTTINGQYGTLTFAANGTYTYTRNPNTPGGVSDVFSYRILDSDGDESIANLTISIGDSPAVITFVPTIGEGTQVDESQLPPRSGEPGEPAGSAFVSGAETTSSTITFTSPDGVSSVKIGGVTLTPGALPQTIVSDATGTLVITAFTFNAATGQGSISYTYTLLDNTLNTSGSTVSFPIVVTDLDNDVANGTLAINIIDDAPTARLDTDSIAAGNYGPATGNVITDTEADGGKDTVGADGAAVAGVAAGNTGAALVNAGTVGTVVQGTYGKLTLNADGSYSYVRDPGTAGGVSDVFTYTLRDGDGDTSVTTLTISIADSRTTLNVPTGEDAGTIVFESGLPARGSEAAGSVPGDGEITNGTITYTAPDGPAVVTIGGTAVTGVGQTFAGAYGTLTITSFSSTSIGYRYVLADNTLAPTSNDSFAVVVTDVDGDSSNATLKINIVDDVPTANPDGVFTVAEQTPLKIDAFANDVAGADSVNKDSGIVLATLPTKGVVVDNGDGTFTYTPNAGAEGPDSFTYTITDGDGDPSTTTVTLNLLADSVPEIVSKTNLVVDEDGFKGANADNGLAGEVTSTGSTTANGTLVATFGADVPANLLGSITLDDSAALDGQLVTLAGSPVTFAKVGNDLVGSADGQDVIRISITAADAGPGASDVTYSYSVTLLQPVQHTVAGSEDSDLLSGIGFTLTDSDGDPVSGTFSVTVVDDIPTLEIGAATASVTEGGAPYEGVWTLDPGADGMTTLSLNVNGAVQSLTLGGAPVTFTLAQGSLTFRADGTYSFQPNGNLDQDLLQAVTLTVSGADRDGDPVSDSITITINDGAGPTGGDTSTLTVNEAALGTAASTGSNPALTTEVATDTLSFTAGSDNLVDFRFTGVAGLAANIDGAGTDLFWTLSADGRTITGALTDGGPAAVTIALTAPASIAANTAGTVGVTVTLADNLPHELALAAQTAALGTVTVIASDQDGDSATGVVTVQVIDDIPDISGNAAAAATLSVDDTTLTTNATANLSSLFTINYNADGPAATGSIAYTLSIAANGTDSGVKDTATGQAVLLTNEAGVIVGRTATGGDIVFTVTVDATTGSVTLDQVRAVVHNPDTGPNQFFDLAADLINLTATIKDGDGDVDSETVGISQGMRFFDDGLRGASLSVFNENSVVLTTQDAETIATASDFAVTTANFSGVFSTTANYGNDLPGTTVLTYALTTVGGTPDSGLDSHGASIILYNIDGVITGSTATSLVDVSGTNTIFTIAVAPTTGIVTLTQFAEIDHAAPGVSSGFDSQLAVLANNLVRLTGTAVYTDGDGDTATLNLAADLGGNIRFADDGPDLTTVLKPGALITIDETNGVVAAGTEVDPDATGNLGSATIAIGDLYTQTLVAGADAPASLTYKLIVTDNTPSGYLISSTNESINLFKVSDTLVEGRGAVSGAVAMTFSVAANGTVTVTQFIAIEHSDTTSNDETSPGMTAGVLTLQTTATDFDGDFDTATVDLGSVIRIEDDGPSITAVTQTGTVTLDETGGLDTGVVSTAAVIGGTFNFGSDGAATSGSTVYGLELTAGGTSVLSTLKTAVGDFAITLFETAANQVTGRYVDGGGVTRDAFTVTIGSDGKLTVTQLVALEHNQDGDTPLHNDPLTLDGFLTATVTIKDSDGDTASASAQVGDQVTFLDDGPSVTAVAAGTVLVSNDETATTSTAAAINTGAIVKGDDPNVGGSGAISTATSVGAVVTATPNYGIDGAAATGSLVYELVRISGNAGVTLTDGTTIFLVQVGDVIVGEVAAGTSPFAGQAAFAIAINSATGEVTVEQYLSLRHGNASNPDDTVQLLTGAVGVQVTATDSDDDFARSNVIDISAQIRFDDDGPTLTDVVGGGSVTLDESGGFDTLTSTTSVINFTAAFGADGPKVPVSTEYAVELTAGGTSQLTSLQTAVGNFAITLVETAANVIKGQYNDGSVKDAFIITMNNNGTITVQQFVALEHVVDGSDAAAYDDALTLNGLITARVTIVDGDNDSTSATTEIGDQITFRDDGLTANADTKSVAEGAVVSGNVLTDNADVFGTDGPDATTPAGGVVGVKAGSDTSTPVTTGTGTTIETALGFLTLNANGTYSYDSKGNTVGTTALTDTFTYTIRDADGDTSTTTLTITINPVTLAGADQTVTVNEAALDLMQDAADLAAGTVTGSNPALTTETVSGTLTTTGASGAVTYTAQTVEDALGKFVLNTNGTYTYTLKSAFDGATLDNGTVTHPAVRVFTYTVTDANGNTDTGTVTIDVIDDVPTARADADSVAEETALIANGNVLTAAAVASPDANITDGVADTQGADGATVTGVIFGTSATPVTGGVGGTVNSTYGSLTLAAGGGYTYTLTNGNATVQALGVGETLTETFTYTITDGDGDTSTTTLTITINGTNDAPTIGSATTAVSEEGLTGGIADTIGTSLTADTTNSKTASGTITVADVDGDTLNVTLGTPATALTSGGVAVIWSLSLDGKTLTGTAGATTVIVVTIDNGGTYNVDLRAPIDHPDNIGTDAATLEDALNLVVPVNVSDGTTTTASASGLVISIEDDSPVAVAPTGISLVNQAGAPVFASLDPSLLNNYGGDGGTPRFAASLNGTNSGLTSNFNPIIYTVSANGLVLTGTANGSTIFTITLLPGSNQYSVDLDGIVDSLTTLNFASGGYQFVGGNTAWAGFVPTGQTTTAPIDDNSKDLLITPSIAGANAGTINGSSVAGGVGSGNAVDAGEMVRVDFVTDLRGDTAGPGGYGDPLNQDHVFDGHYVANGASALFTATGGSTIKITAKDDPDGNNVVGDGNIDPITKIVIAYNGVASAFITPTTTPTNYTVNGITYTVTLNGDGSVNVAGVQGTSGAGAIGTQIAVYTGNGYSSLEFAHAGGSNFKLGDFGVVVQNTQPVNFTVPVVVVDGDGDTSAAANLAITLTAPPVPPIVLDLDGDGAEFLPTAAGVAFDFNGDGARESTAWAGSDDGLLAVDLNGDGRITSAAELVFGGNGLTDLQGLAAKYDSNGDGAFTAADADFVKFGVWQDANSNGVTDAGEFRSLSDAGIVSISLTSDGKAYTAADGTVEVAGTGTYTKADGTVLTLADASFAIGGDTVVSAARSQDRAMLASPLAGALAAAVMVTMDQMHLSRPDAEALVVRHADALMTRVAAIESDAGVSGAAHDDFDARALLTVVRDFVAELRTSSLGAGEADAHDSRGLGADNALAHAQDAPMRTVAEADDAGLDHGFGHGSGSDSMAGLIGLADAAPQLADATNQALSPQAILEDVLGGNSVDHLLAAVADQGAATGGTNDPGSFDLASFLNQDVHGSDAVMFRQSITEALHEMTVAS